MNITNVYFKQPTEEELNKNKNLIGTADITIDGSFVVHDIKLLSGEKGEYVIFPKNKYERDIAFPIKNETRLDILNSILNKKLEIESNKL